MFIGKLNGHFRAMLAGAAMSALVFGAAPALAETPADTLVQAWAIDDTITLDPANPSNSARPSSSATPTICWCGSTSTTRPR